VLRFALVGLLFLVIARTFWRFVDGVVRGVTGEPQRGARRTAPRSTAVKMSPCPVCGTYVVPASGVRAEVRGQTHLFCSAACCSTFMSRA
jgi:YHS domain-containing protein